MSATATTTNLWVSLLRESSKRAQTPESTCIVLGDKDCGKRSFMEKLCCNPCKTENDDMVSYNYFAVEEGAYEFTSKINLWSFGENIFDKSVEIIGNANVQDKLSFFVLVDLSRPDECISSLLKWLTKVSQYIQKLEHSKQTKSIHISYLKSARMNKGNVFVPPEHDNANDDHKFDFIESYFSHNIIVVGTKSDLMRSNDGFTAKRGRELQGQLRSICLEIGASLVYNSIFLQSTDTPSGPPLKEYLLHRLYPELLALQHGIEDSLDGTFIPSGFDTVDMIKNSSGLESLYDFKSKFIQYRSTLVETKPEDNNEIAVVTNASDYHVDIEHEQEWLSGLQNFINQAAASGSSMPVPNQPSSMPGSKVPSEASLSTMGEEPSPTPTSTAGPKDNAADADKKPPVKPTRRVSAAAKPGDPKDATDFFKKMLESSNNKK